MYAPIGFQQGIASLTAGTQKDLATEAFAAVGPRLWNSLPSYLLQDMNNE